jgi:hypothetical protein
MTGEGLLETPNQIASMHVQNLITVCSQFALPPDTKLLNLCASLRVDECLTFSPQISKALRLVIGKYSV